MLAWPGHLPFLRRCFACHALSLPLARSLFGLSNPVWTVKLNILQRSNDRTALSNQSGQWTSATPVKLPVTTSSGTTSSGTISRSDRPWPRYERQHRTQCRIKKRERTRSLSQRFAKVSVISFLPGDPTSFGQYLKLSRKTKNICESLFVKLI